MCATGSASIRKYVKPDLRTVISPNEGRPRQFNLASGALDRRFMPVKLAFMLTRQEQTQLAEFNARLSAALPAYRYRDAQRQMADAVAATFDRCRQNGETEDSDGSNLLVCESGTATGKTFAYAVPGIVLARSVGKRLVISSSTIALQEQLMVKDLPLLQKCAQPI